MDTVKAGDEFRLKVTRDAVSDDATGDAQITKVVVRET